MTTNIRPTLAALPLAILLVGGLGIGFAPIFVRLADVGPIPAAFWRMALAMPFFLLLLWVADQRSAKTATRPVRLNRRDAAVLILCGLLFAGDLAVWHWSIVLTSVANATLFANLTPIYVAVIGFLFLGERFSRLFLLGMAAALSGAFVLLGRSLDLGGEQLTGDLLGLLTTVFYGSYFLAAARLRRRFSTQQVMAFTCGITALVLLPMALVSGEVFWPASAGGWGALLGLALVSQVAGQGCIVYALAHLPAAFSTVSLLIQPVIAALAAWYLFGEALGPWQGLGAVMVLIGIVLARLGLTR